MPHRLIIDGELILYGDVGDIWGDGTGFSSIEVMQALAEMTGDITVRLNSGGGLVTEGDAIYSALARYKGGEVTIVVDGIAASAASLIFMAAKKRKRWMNIGSLLMVHDPSGFTFGTAEDHEKAAEVLNKMADTFADVYAAASGKTVDEVREIMREETWYSPDEAVTEGFAGEVVNRPEGAAEATASLVEPSKFDYMAYSKAPNSLTAGAQRAFPKEWTAQKAGTKETGMDPKELLAKAEAEATEIVNAAKAEAERIEAEAKAKDAAAQETAKAAAERVIADAEAKSKDILANARAAADVLEAEAKAKREADDRVKAAQTATADILGRCNVAKLTLEQSLEVVNKANGNVDQAVALITDAVAKREKDPTIVPGNVTADARDKFKEGATKAVMFRAGIAGGERNEFTSMTLRELARHSLAVAGVNKVFADPMEMIRAAFAPVMAAGLHSTSDFVEILANVANKSMLKGWEEAEETFAKWTSKGSLVDFKPAKRVDLNLFPALTEVPEGAEYLFGTIGDRGETIQLATYGKMFAITRQAIINDDLNAFSRIPQKMGRAAKRTIGNLVYAVLTSNPAMGDGITLFHDDHGNFIDGSGTGDKPTVTSVTAGISAMALQKDPDEHATGGLNISPSYMLVPVELFGVAQALMSALNDPAATTPNVPNTVRGVAEVIKDARLSANSTKIWYLAANPNQYDTIEVAYLNGNEQPVLEQREGWYVDGVEFKVRMDAGVKALDFRGLLKNKGET